LRAQQILENSIFDLLPHVAVNDFSNSGFLMLVVARKPIFIQQLMLMRA
jgi:hypothetical protein